MSDKYKTVGVYIHIPFCKSKCLYCDFCSVEELDHLMDPYQSAIIKHIKEFTSRMDDYYVDTVYFGGGTPSYYGFRRVDEIFETIKKNYKVMRDAEITIEANPESVTKDDFIKLKRSGFTRVSLGVQSLDNKMLKRIGRIHTVEQTYNAIDAIRAAGFDNLSLDLIYGLPSQTREEWAETLTEAMRTGPEHISAYGLTIGQNSKLWNLRNSPGIPDDDAQADMYLYAVDSLNNSGFHQYEISNYSKPGKESIHNLKYWTLKEYCGFGASASSMIGGTRFTYLKDVENYINAVESGGALLVTDETETLNPYETAAEYIMVGMRTTNGVSRNEYESIYRGGFLPLEQILDSYIRLGFAVKRGNRYSFTPKGFLLSNRLIGELLDAQAERKFQIGTPWRENDYFNTLI